MLRKYISPHGWLIDGFTCIAVEVTLEISGSLRSMIRVSQNPDEIKTCQLRRTRFKVDGVIPDGS